MKSIRIIKTINVVSVPIVIFGYIWLINLFPRTNRSELLIFNVLLLVCLTMSIFGGIKSKLVNDRHLYREAFNDRYWMPVENKSSMFYYAVLSGETEYVKNQSPKKLGFLCKYLYAEYMALIGDYDKLQEIINDIESNPKSKKLGPLKFFHLFLENNYEAIIEFYDEKISGYTQHIILAGAYYWKGYSFYKLGKMDEAYNCFKEVNKYGYNTIYQDKARELCPEIMNEQKIIPDKEPFKWSPLYSVSIIMGICLILLTSMMLVPVRDTDIKGLMAKKFRKSSSDFYLIDEQPVGDLTQSLYIDPKTNTAYYMVFQLKDGKYEIVDSITEGMEQRSNYEDDSASEILFNFYINHVKLSLYYKKTELLDCDKYAVSRRKVNTNSEYLDTDIELIGMVGPNNEYYLYKID